MDTPTPAQVRNPGSRPTRASLLEAEITVPDTVDSHAGELVQVFEVDEGLLVIAPHHI